MQLETKTQLHQHTIEKPNMTCGKSESKSHIPAVTKTSALPKVTHRFTDNFYKYDLEEGTKLDNRDIEPVDIINCIFFSISYFVCVPVIAIGIILTFPPIILAAAAAIIVCTLILFLGEGIFFSIIRSDGCLQHAQQMLAPTTQEQANTLQRQAIEVCKKKQSELDNLRAIIDDAFSSDNSSTLSKETCKEIGDKDLKGAPKKHSTHEVVELDEIRSLTESISKLKKIYNVKSTIDNDGKIDFQANGTPNLEDLPK
ncbi:hypothetical protein [Kistimonas asteriae]|uniref:hypothetical protein n=1 Tax=Kistimonas asteriae TaxID=517724 RepID=UPI001BA7E5B9|nr:hypothetical protein [Kistimonas asteriae]